MHHEKFFFENLSALNNVTRITTKYNAVTFNRAFRLSSKINKSRATIVKVNTFCLKKSQRKIYKKNYQYKL